MGNIGVCVLNVSFFSLYVKKNKATQLDLRKHWVVVPLLPLVPGTVVTVGAEVLKAASSLAFVCVLNGG